MRLLVTRPMTERAERAIRAEFDVTFHDDTALSEGDAARALREYDLIMPTLGDRLTETAFAGGGLRCRMLGNFGAGYNHIDVAAAKAAGVVVSNTPDVVTDATADIALTLILMVARRAGEGERLLRRGEWSGWKPTQMLGSHVSGKTVGIVGMGRIGKAIARRCHLGFGMGVVFFNRSTVRLDDIPGQQISDLQQMLDMADFAVIAVPGGAGTRHLIGASELNALGPQGFLINIARGDVVDEAALIDALQSGSIAGAGLDVYEREPEVPPALCQIENAVLLPHLGTATEEVRTDMALRALSNLVAFRDGRTVADRVA